MTLSITPLNIMAVRHGKEGVTLSIMALERVLLCSGSFVLSVPNKPFMLIVIMLSAVMLIVVALFVH